MSDSGFDKNGSLEIVLIVRDKDGNPTGKTRSFRTDDGSKLSFWFEQNAFRKKKKKKVVPVEKAATAKQAEEILADLYEPETDEE